MEHKDRRAVLQPLLQIVKDVKDWRQGCTCDLFTEIDLFARKLTNLVMSRGIHYLLVDLPDIGKAYDAGLSSGIFDMSSISSDFQGKRGHQSWFYQGLLADTFDEYGKCLNPDENVVFFTRQILYMYKKVSLACPPENIRRTVDEFIQIEGDLKSPSGSWDQETWQETRYRFSDCRDLVAAHPRGGKLWELVDHVFGSIVPGRFLNPSDIRPRHGPGSVADQKSGKDKYVFPTWPDKLAGTFPLEDFSSPNWSTFSDLADTICVSNEEPPARLLAVPKTFKGPRLIASEPISHQFLQQGLMVWLRQNMTPPLRRSIDFTSQVPSQDAAIMASIDGKSATVDLSSASDRLTCFVVERAFGSNQSLLRALHAVRTRRVCDATGSYPDLCFEVKKFAAQGSAVTFPVQTIVYAGLCISAVLFVNNRRPRLRNIMKAAGKVRVFGDDICLPQEAVPVLALMLHSLGLKVNRSKTHCSGKFRESCGVDAYNGHNVSPCYLSSWSLGPSSEELSSWVDVSNNAHRAGLWNLASWMSSQVPSRRRRLFATTDEEGDGFRFFTFCHGFVTESRSRWNENLHRDEYRLLCIRSRVRRRKRGSWQDLYQYLLEDPTPDCHWESGYLTKKSTVFKVDWVPRS